MQTIHILISPRSKFYVRLIYVVGLGFGGHFRELQSPTIFPLVDYFILEGQKHIIEIPFFAVRRGFIEVSLELRCPRMQVICSSAELYAWKCSYKSFMRFAGSAEVYLTDCRVFAKFGKQEKVEFFASNCCIMTYVNQNVVLMPDLDCTQREHNF